MDKNETAKLILRGLLIGGVILIASSSPYFVMKAWPKIIKYAAYKIKNRKNDKKRFSNTFYYLRRKGLIDVDNRNGQIYISLTKDGKKKAERYHLDDLKIEKPKKWDKKWRVLIFDIPDINRIKREALRGKIKELGFYQLQKSVWVYPYEFKKEIVILRDFFGFNKVEMKIITATEIEDSGEMEEFFGVQ